MPRQAEGTLTPADESTTHVVPFVVPSGLRSFRLKFNYTPDHPEGAELRNQISASIYGPDGKMAEINRPDRWPDGVTIGPEPSGGVGAKIVTPGEWKLFISTHRVVSPDVHFTVDLEWHLPSDEVRPPRVDATPLPDGWLRGDLHAHTWYSDGHWTTSALASFMVERGLDFATLTDHNTIDGLPEFLSYNGTALVTLGGNEVSTFNGHMLALGVTDRLVDWRYADGTLRPVPDIAAEIHEAGGIAVICHPLSIGDPWCCGCRWEHADMMPGNAAAVEIWNGIWDEDKNGGGIKLWQSWLTEGHKLVATAGSDIHGPPPAGHLAHRAAHNVVYAPERNRHAILEALKVGRSYVSTGPVGTLQASSSSGTWFMGQTVEANEVVTVTATWNGVPSGARQVVRVASSP
jgi:predicted metal-dependent phosphoesterase TrpH